MRSVIVCLILLLSFLPVARATTYVVNPEGTGDFPTIQAAIDAVVDGDVIELTDGTFVGDGNRDIYFLGKAITVRSQSGDPTSCIVDCQGSQEDPHRGFFFWNHESALSRLEGITITGAYARGNGGAIYCDNAEPTFTSLIISNCVAWNGGGAELATTEGWPAWGPTFVDCIFVGNSCGGPNCWGGAVLVDGIDAPNDPTFIGCTFAHNSAGVGGALMCADTWEGSPEITGCTFDDNHAETGSNIAYSWTRPALVVENTIIANGTGGAGLACYGPEVAELTCCDIYGNEGGDWVGDIAGQLGVNGNISLHPLFCGPEIDDFTLAENSPCAPFSPPNEQCDLIGTWPVGCGPMGLADDRRSDEAGFVLRVSPNPFSRETHIACGIPGAATDIPIHLGVFDATGRLVRALACDRADGGTHIASWDGRDQMRSPLGSGMYYVRLRAGGQERTIRLMLLR